MRPRGSVTGPLLLIAIGIVFLVHTISPTFPIIDLIAQYWPYVLIVWGAIQIVEISIWTAMGRSIPMNGISGGSWLLVVLICFFGLGAFEVRQPDAWWRHAGFEQGVEMLGPSHDYSISPIEKNAGKTPHIVIESFRGNAKITGTDGMEVTVTGHKTIHSMDPDAAERTNQVTPVDVSVDGDTITIRCNQDKSGPRTMVSTDLELSVPHSATIEATGTVGDFDISSVAGNVDITSENAAVRLQDIAGHVKIDTRQSDVVRCVHVDGPVDLRGRGMDVELGDIAGPVTIEGDYGGTLSLKNISKPVRIESGNTDLALQQVKGELTLDRGTLSAQNVVGPVKLSCASTDVDLDGFSDGAELSVEKGDVDLKPAGPTLGKLIVHTRAGNIELALPQTANFAITASTDHGEIENEFGEVLKESTEGRGARLEGAVGSGPDLNLTTGRGTITVRKADGGAESAGSKSSRTYAPNVKQIEL